jgi:hypothetical protein
MVTRTVSPACSSRKYRTCASGPPFALHIVEVGADQVKSFVEGAVEQDMVIGHIQMAIIIDPLRLDPQHGRDEGREEQGLELDQIESDLHEASMPALRHKVEASHGAVPHKATRLRPA